MMLCSGGRFVVKFGGSSLRDSFEEALSFVSRLWDENEVVVVVSALKGVTDMLEGISRGNGSVQSVEELHLEFAKRKGVSPSVLSPILEELRGINTLNLSREAFRDHVLSLGEMLSGIIFTEALRRRGIPAVLFEPWEILMTDGRFGNAEIDLRASRKTVKPVEEALEEGLVPVVPGFVGGYSGFRTTLGRNGSDYTASALGSLLGASGVIIMSDVEGIYTADPRKVLGARLIPFVSSGEAYVAARLGMKVLHPKAAEVAGPIHLGRTRDWHIGTVVGDESSGMPIVTYRVEGSDGIVSVVGVDSLGSFPFERHEEKGIPWVSIRVPLSRLGSALNAIHWEVVGRRIMFSRTLSTVQVVT